MRRTTRCASVQRLLMVVAGLAVLGLPLGAALADEPPRSGQTGAGETESTEVVEHEQSLPQDGQPQSAPPEPDSVTKHDPDGAVLFANIGGQIKGPLGWRMDRGIWLTPGFHWYRPDGVVTGLQGFLIDGNREWCVNAGFDTPTGGWDSVGLPELGNVPDIDPNLRITADHQMAYLLRVHESSEDPYVNAALASLVHVNYEQNNAKSIRIAKDLNDSLPHMDETSYRIYRKAWEMVDMARNVSRGPAAAGLSLTGSSLAGSETALKIGGLGVWRSSDDAYQAGADLSVTIDGPAVFDDLVIETGAVSSDGKTWTGKTASEAITLPALATADGTVTVKAAYANVPADKLSMLNRSGDRQSTLMRGGGTTSLNKDATIKVEVPEPEIRTHASGTLGGMVPASELATVVDTVDYQGLRAGKEYLLKGTLKLKSTGNDLVVNGTPITASKAFVPEASSGSVDLIFSFDARSLMGQSLVVFEDLLADGELVATHSDLDDLGQTVQVPSVRTTATNKQGGKRIYADQVATVLDKVCYENVTAGRDYSVTGTLMDRRSGRPLLVEGEQIVSSVAFEAEQSDGCLEVEFKLNANGLSGTQVVVFEDLFAGETLLASHADIDSEEQTVGVEAKPPAPPLPKTGTTQIGATIAAGFLVGGLGVAFWSAARARRG